MPAIAAMGEGGRSRRRMSQYRRGRKRKSGSSLDLSIYRRGRDHGHGVLLKKKGEGKRDGQMGVS